MSEREEVAAVMDATFDWLLEHGRCTAFGDAEGRGCIIHALGRGTQLVVSPKQLRYQDACDAYDELFAKAQQEFRRNIPLDIVSWNYDATDDEVFDALKLTAKQLREVTS